MATEDWVSLGPAAELAKRELQQLKARRTPIALCYRDGQFTALSGVCNHVGGPLGDGVLDGDYVTCPWHFWKFHFQTGRTRPEIGDGSVPTYQVKVEEGTVLVDLASAGPRKHIPHPPHPLARPVKREPGPIRVVGISTTMMNQQFPRGWPRFHRGAAGTRGICRTEVVTSDDATHFPLVAARPSRQAAGPPCHLACLRISLRLEWSVIDGRRETDCIYEVD